MTVNLPYPNIELQPGKEPTPAEVVEWSRKVQANLEALAKNG
jgi:hypothetical protein